MRVATSQVAPQFCGGPPDALASSQSELIDSRFRALVGEAAWTQLPDPVRRRFSKRLAPVCAVTYRGEVVQTQLSPAGRVLAFLARFIGSPLPLDNGAAGESVVTVTEEAAAQGQTWTRSYARPSGAFQIIRSMKCFRGPTGLEEHVGAGIGMALRVTVEEGALIFRSVHYFVEVGRLRLEIPRALSPGEMQIVHRQETDGSFSFRLTLTHPRFGRLLHQLAYYRDA